MPQYTNALGQPVGRPVPDWVPPAYPAHQRMTGRYADLEPLDAERHGPELYRAEGDDGADGDWTYLPYGPFDSQTAYMDWLHDVARGDDPLFFAIVDKVSRRALGLASYLRIKPGKGTIEVGHLKFSPPLQGTRMATEAMYLMMRHAFELGYRRYEWKCDALNARSRAAAQRLGFRFEGVFRNAMVYKGRNRDTAWYAIIDTEWPGVRTALERWLSPENFDEDGNQLVRLAQFHAPGGVGGDK